VGKPNERERERDLIIMLQESTKQQQIYISSHGKYLTAPNLSHKNLPRFPCQNRTTVRPPSASFSMPTVSCTNCSVRPKNREQKTKIHLEICARNSSISMPNPYGLYGIVQTVRTRTVRPPTVEKYFGQKFTENFSRESCPLCCSLSSLEHAQKISLTLLPMCSQHPPNVFTTCLAHYPMHSFII
jgi:hypothetical protein